MKKYLYLSISWLLMGTCQAGVVSSEQTKDQIIVNFSDKSQWILPKSKVFQTIQLIGTDTQSKRLVRTSLRDDLASKISTDLIDPASVLIDYDPLTGDIKNLTIFTNPAERLVVETAIDTVQVVTP